MSTLRFTEDEVHLAAALLKEGKLIAFPTETVYGLGAPIFNPTAIASIFVAKGRPSDNPLIAHISDLSQIELIAKDIPKLFHVLADAFFPGPLTVVLRRHPNVPLIVSGGLDTIALRMPDHPLAQALIQHVGEPLVAPSANLSGKPSSTSCDHVITDFEGKIAGVIDGGKTQYGIESTVISLVGDVPILLRPGAVSLEEIEEVLGVKVGIASDLVEGAVHSPGMKYRHYAPSTPITLFTDPVALTKYIESSLSQRLLVLSKTKSFESACHSLPLSAPELYSSLRLADAENFEEILIYCDPETLSNRALMNRVTRAAGLKSHL